MATAKSTSFGGGDSLYPEQRLTERQKRAKFGSLDKWGQAVIESIIRLSGYNTGGKMAGRYDMEINYNLYDNIFDSSDLERVCNPVGVNLKGYEFPATLANYNKITPKINLLLGEEIKRPFNFRAVSTGSESVSRFEEKKKEMVIRMLEMTILQEMQAAGEQVQITEDGSPKTPEEIEKYFRYTYQDLHERAANQALKYLIKFNDAAYEFNRGWKDLLVGGADLYWVGIINGEPKFRRVEPRYFWCERSSHSNFVDESQWAFEVRYMTPAEIHDEFLEDLTEKSLEELDKLMGGAGLTLADSGLGVPVRYSPSDSAILSGTETVDSVNLIRVVKVEWVGLRKVGFLTYISEETGKLEEDMVDEGYAVKDGEEVEWRWINEVWEGTRIGTDVFIGIRPKQVKFNSLDNPSSHKLGYTGAYLDTSPVELVKAHQYLFNIIMYRMELTMAVAKGKVLLYDIAQLPRSHGFNVDKWLYYLNALGIGFINSFEEGTGRFQGRTSSFNQFQALDLSMARVIDQYVAILDRLDSLIGELFGVSRQREGQVQSSELVGNVERSVVQSSHITEPLFYMHNECKRRVLQNLLDCAKLAWIEGKKAPYILDDMSRMVFSIEGSEFSESEFGIFISNASKDDVNMQSARRLLEMAVQTGKATLSDIAQTLDVESLADLKAKVKDIEEDAMERQSQQQQQLEQMKNEQADKELAMRQQEIALRERELDIEEQNNIRDNETRRLNAELSQDRDIKEAKLSLEKDKIEASKKASQDDQDFKRAKLESDKTLKEKQIQSRKPPKSK